MGSPFNMFDDDPSDIHSALLSFLRDEVDFTALPLLLDEGQDPAVLASAFPQPESLVPEPVRQSNDALTQLSYVAPATQRGAQTAGHLMHTGAQQQSSTQRTLSSAAATFSSTQSGSGSASAGKQHATANPKKRPTSQHKVADLEKLVAEQTAKLQQLSIDNEFMAVRVRMLELVIEVRGAHLDRLTAIHHGPQNNPFDFFMGKTVQEMKAMTPHEAAALFTQVCAHIALKLTPLLPALEQHPELIVGPTASATWSQYADGQAPWPLGVEEGMAAGWLILGQLPYPLPVLQGLHELVLHVRRMQGAYMYLYFMCPQLVVSCGLNLQQVKADEHTSWQVLATAIATQARSQPLGYTGPGAAIVAAPPAAPPAPAPAPAPAQAGAASQQQQQQRQEAEAAAAAAAVVAAVAASASGGATAGAPQEPLVAPSTHWRSVVQHIRLSDQQVLQTAALCDILIRPLSDMLYQRTTTVVAIAWLIKETTARCSGQVPLDAPCAGAAAAIAAALLNQQTISSQGQALVSSALQQAQLDNAREGRPLRRLGTQGASNGSSGPVVDARVGLDAGSLAGADLASADGSSVNSCLVAYKPPEVMQLEEALLRRLQRLLTNEMALIVLASEVFYRHILTPVQLPLLMVNSYPYTLDTLAIIHAVADLYSKR